MEGERTISRPITNEYGTVYDPLSFTYALIKADGEKFTEEEQVAVERWLTSKKLSSELRITNCNEYFYSYFGLFTNTNWIQGNGGFMAVSFTFSVNGAYPFKHTEMEIWNAENRPSATPLSEDEQWITIEPENMVTVYCDSDELEEYVYPIIVSKAINGVDNSSFSICQMTDGGKVFSVYTDQESYVIADCERCMVYTGYQTLSGVYVPLTQYKFTDMRWKDTGYIYWPRLLPGENTIAVKGNVILTLSYYTPYKKIGGWLA